MSATAISAWFSGRVTAVLDELPFYEGWGGGAFTKPAGSGGCRCMGVIAARDERGVGGTEAHGRVWPKCFARADFPYKTQEQTIHP